MEPQLHPLAHLKSVYKVARKQRHDAVCRVRHDSEGIGKEYLDHVARTIDGQLDGGIGLQIPSVLREKRSGP
jgi:hypothetical protein